MITLTREEAQKILDALEYAYDNEMFVGMRVILRAKLSEPEIAQFKFQEYGPDNWGDSQVTKPEFVAEQKATNEALRSMVQSEPTIDGWPLYSGLPTPPDNFIDAIRYNTAISQGDQRIDPTKIYKEPEPESVAYINVEERKLEWATPIKWETPTVVKMDKVPLYTAPPQREWVGLTDDERDKIREQAHYEFDDISNAIETKLKEKNNG